MNAQSVTRSIAGFFLLTGLALYLLFSPYLLDSLGYHYIGESGMKWEKLHPGSYCILLSLVFFSRKELIPYLTSHHKAVVVLFLYYCLLCIYMALRSAPSGMAFMMDGHIMVAVCALILCAAPHSICRKALKLFVVAAIANSIIGLGEAISETRMFTFSDNTVFVREEYFRSSALLGHPLANALFTASTLFVTLALSIGVITKFMLTGLFIASLVAFGSRSALFFSVLFLLFYGATTLYHHFRNRSLPLLQLITILVLAIAAPIVLASGLYLLIESHIGDRITAFLSLTDDSAQARLLAFSVFDYMTDAEIWLGMSLNRIEAITDQMNQNVNLSLIENPWLLMFMHLGALQFVVWFGITLTFIHKLIKREPLALQMAVITYFAIASGFNSFAAKSLGYPLMVCFVISASRIVSPQKYPHER